MSGSPRPVAKRVVKPRKSGGCDYPIIAVDQNEVMLESGEVFPFSDFAKLVKTQPSSIIVSHHFGGLLKWLNSEFKDDPHWQFRVKPLERQGWSPNMERKSRVIQKDCIVNYFGFTGKNKEKGRYHYALSPQIFCLRTVNELRRNAPGEDATITKLMAWATEIRTYLQKYQLNLSPTSGGIAAQLMRDKKFYPEPRRKVPRKTNAAMRDHLPGNFYRLYDAEPGKGFHRAAYLDQIAAHHSAAMILDFPNANTLERRGRYSSLKDRAYAAHGTKFYDQLISQHGLFYLAIEVPHLFANDFVLPEVGEKPGYKRGFFYSNELPYLETLGVRIRHIIASWTSPHTDPGINAYARWASAQVEQSETLQKAWLKPTLLSAYGILAAKPKHQEYGYKTCAGGIPKKYACGSGFLDVEAAVSKKMIEPAMANVIHRGMVEAQTRLTSLKLARKLSLQGFSILAIYADSVFVKDANQLPFLEHPWRVQDFLSRLRFDSSTHFTSDQICKTPGIPTTPESREWLPRRPAPVARPTT